jgi:hypothetical protein
MLHASPIYEVKCHASLTPAIAVAEAKVKAKAKAKAKPKR